MSLAVTDGAGVRAALTRETDVVIVGSGPGGATVARACARAGARVVIVEEGALFAPGDAPEDSFTAMARMYRDMGASVLLGNAPMPFLQGRAVGGTSVINGAISWRLPRYVWDEWIAADPALADALPWATLDALWGEIESDLNIHPTEEAIAGPNNLLLGVGAAALGLAHRPIARNVRGCRGLGRCMQSCPEGNKMSMDRTYLPDACAHGAEILARVTATAVEHDGARATGVLARAAGGGEVRVTARRAVVLAASAVQTPWLLMRSGIRDGPVGREFACHPGVSMSGRFREPVRMWTGATQGHEVTGLTREGLKFEALGYDMALVATRLKGFGGQLAGEIGDLAHWANWGAAIRSTARGRIRAGRHRAGVRLSLTRDDLVRARRGVRLLGEMMLAAGAEYVTPGVHGWHERVTDRAVMARFEDEGPLSPKAYAMAVTHMFGTCRMGSDPARSVVRPDFRHHALDRLYVADSSVFPSNTGVNPQTSIIALAALCARHVSDSAVQSHG